jgi:hypothetical protein
MSAWLTELRVALIVVALIGIAGILGVMSLRDYYTWIVFPGFWYFAGYYRGLKTERKS